jgi:hypothetical protein
MKQSPLFKKKKKKEQYVLYVDILDIFFYIEKYA